MKITKKYKRLIIALTAMLVAGAVFLTGAYYTINKKIYAVPAVLLSESGIDINDKSIRLIAQGGLSGLAPENTYIAVEQAVREGFTAVEINIRESLDGVWVLMKDSTINKMTDGCGRINKITYFDLLNFTVDNGANIDEYPGTRIAELEDVLDLCAKFNARPFIGIEQSSEAGLGKIAEIIAVRADTQNFSVMSSNRELLMKFRNLSPQTELWLATDKLSNGNIDWLNENKNIGVIFDIGKKANTNEKIEQVIKDGIKVAVRNVNDVQTIRTMYALGVRNFYTGCVLPR